MANPTIAELLKLALAGVSCGPPYPGTAPDNTPAPFVVVGAVIRAVNNSFKGPSNFQRDRVQLDCYGGTYLQAESVAQEVEALMAAQSPYSSPPMFSSMSLTHEYMGVDPDVKCDRVMLEFAVWYKP